MNKNYKLTIAYDGSRFFGWERQPGRDTIQGKLETVLAKLTGAPADVIGAGRTDAGVHARAMVASVRLDTDLSSEEIRDYLNRYLPDAIAVYQEDNRAGVEDLLSKGRVDFIFPADYRAGMGLDTTVQNIIRKMTITDALAEENARQFRQIGKSGLPYQASLFE